jgi:hypothetical protein
MACGERLGPGATQDEVDVGSFGVDIEVGEGVVEDAWVMLLGVDIEVGEGVVEDAWVLLLGVLVGDIVWLQ